MRFYEAGKIPPQGRLYFIYGDGGTGKTTLFKSFPGKKKLLISFDLSISVLSGDESVDIVSIEPQDLPIIQDQSLKCIYFALQNQKYDAVGIDNVTALQNYVLQTINKSKDNRNNYQELQHWFRELGTNLKLSNKNIYVTAHQVDKGPEFMEGRFAADMNEKTFNAFTSMFDVVGRIYIKDGERLIDLDPEKGNHAKNRLDDRKLIKANELFTEFTEEK
ncbi:nucleotide-binding protein [Limosilactobacillus fermentum]|uniref:AAA family ATPase n=1 Tax=Limosilactobacillus fermentum TaxID=1613 RepID=UPI000E096AF7|nr:AAA family ATPase [Limosilactobacillus fermentum]RDG20907.1 nucleotide-binding protein [Limosilactobacillus fermentum]